MNKDDIETLRKNYYNAIAFLQTKEDILGALPSPDYVNVSKIILGVVARLVDEKDNILQLLSLATNDEERVYLEKELAVCEFKISACGEILEKAALDTEIEEQSIGTKKHIIFAISGRGNTILENDLKSIPEEYYETILNCLDEIEQGSDQQNVEKGRMLVNNAKLNKIRESKDFKVRVHYYSLCPDCAFLFLARMKKDDNSMRDQDEVFERAKTVKRQYEELKKMMTDSSKKEEIIRDHAVIIERIREILKTKRR